MTVEIAETRRDDAAAPYAPQGLPALHLAPRGDGHDEVARMVVAAGALLDWQGAFLLDLSAGAGAGVPASLARVWLRAEVERPALGTGWLTRVYAETWQDPRLRWCEPDAGDADPCAFLVVPVRGAEGVHGTLCFYGPDLLRPDQAATGLLDVIAGILARDLAPAPAPRETSPGEDALERAMAMVDVFAFTVCVGADGSLPWRYFGPNSDAIFGDVLLPDEPLTAMLGRYAHQDDAGLVEEFEQALRAGRPVDLELRIVGPDEVTRWISWRALPRVRDGAAYVDGVATDVSARRALESVRTEPVHQVSGDEVLREHARLVRDANDGVLQRIFAAGLRLQILKRKVSEVEAHAVTAIAFQLDQAATDLRGVVIELSRLADRGAD